MSERFGALCADLAISCDVELAIIDMISKWRNVAVHTDDRSVKLASSTKAILKDAAHSLRQKNSHIDINLAVENLENRKMPVPKEITTLISMSVNFCRKVDQAAIVRVAGNREGMRQVVDRILADCLQQSDKASAMLAELMQGSLDRKKRGLRNVLRNLGISELATTQGRSAGRRTDDGEALPVSALLPDSYLDELAELSLPQLRQRFLLA
ncbi:hypothetical protein [Sphingomonas mollis]|uniref:Uncharacterized protein n=1 Tax=Sphingomonas mollis TaxID=2795726 RepID=A0ABS0XSC9_9SPHN|nr:hypothetical protein [Sphingomonas sp. BT553]MBJ6122947.1 hypothetical protein [Sphingomonas sp. BT553]